MPAILTRSKYIECRKPIVQALEQKTPLSFPSACGGGKKSPWALWEQGGKRPWLELASHRGDWWNTYQGNSPSWTFVNSAFVAGYSWDQQVILQGIQWQWHGKSQCGRKFPEKPGWPIVSYCPFLMLPQTVFRSYLRSYVKLHLLPWNHQPDQLFPW